MLTARSTHQRLSLVGRLIMLVVMLLSFQAFVQRVPFDISEAETEIMEGPLMEYSGPKLALFKYAQMAKLVIYSALFVALFVPLGSGLPFPLGWLIFWAKVLALVLLVTWLPPPTPVIASTRRSATSPALLAVATGGAGAWQAYGLLMR